MKQLTVVEGICIGVLIAVASFMVGRHFPTLKICAESFRPKPGYSVIYYSVHPSDQMFEEKLGPPYRPGQNPPPKIMGFDLPHDEWEAKLKAPPVRTGKNGAALNPLNRCTPLVAAKNITGAEACFNDAYPGSGTDMRKRGDLTLIKP